MSKSISRPLQVMLGVLFIWAAAGACLAAAPNDTATHELFRQADNASSTNHRRYLALLAELHARESTFDPAQRQHLAYLDALGYDLADDTTQAALRYRMIIDHPVDPHVVMRAKVALIAIYLRQRDYLKAYSRANALMEKLPTITDPELRAGAYNIILRVLFNEGQFTKAHDYARQMLATADNDRQRCLALVFLTQSQLYQDKTLVEVRGDFDRALSTCRAAGTAGVANSLYTVLAGVMLDKGKPRQVIAYLEKHRAIIEKSQFRLHLAVFHVVMAQAHIKLGQYDQARQSALAALKESPGDSYRWSRMTAYKLLYEIADHEGNAARALAMHEKYMDQYKAYADDAKSQALAYQMVKQDVLTNKMEMANLNKQNKILHLRQSLDRKSVENSRLYVLLLTLVLLMLVLWAYRTKHSQMRFRRMARHDDLTDAYSRQYFLDQSEQTLERLKKTASHACMLILDMDHFKRINDRYGHIHGDTVLRHVALVCRSELRDSDVFGRLGGEEFGIFMPGCAAAHGREIGERIRKALSERSVRITTEESVTVTASIGMACTSEFGYGLKRLMSQADAALYDAKRAGRNQIMISTGLTAQTAN